MSFDDPYLCYDNPLVRHFDLKKVLTSTVADDYMPVVTASFALENKLFGLDPFYFHLDNLLLHLANVILVFVLLRMLTHGGLVIPGVTALLFGLHPLHVESVMWVSQRKDMLSTLFSLLSLLFYLLSVQKNGRSWWVYGLSLLCFLLALGSKFMAVSLPAVTLLLAWYQGEEKKKTALKLLPYVALMIGFAMIHIGLHKPSGANATAGFDLLAALGRGVDSLAFYLTKTILPFKLGVFYERNVVTLSWFEYAMLGTWTAALVLMFKYISSQRKLMAVSLLIFLGTLFPVLQIVPFGNNFAFADRFMYFPSIGLFAVFGILVSEAMKLKYKFVRAVCGGLLAGLCLSFSYLSFAQALTWKSSETLWQNVLNNYPKSSVAHNNLGLELVAQDRTQEAQTILTKAVELNPKYAEPRVNLAVLYMQANALEAAKTEIAKALELNPSHSGAYYNLGVIAEKENRSDLAVQSYQKVMELDTTNVAAPVNMAAALYRLGKKDEAVGVLKHVLEIDPGMPEALNNLGAIYLEMGLLAEATEALQRAIKADPYYEEPRKSLAVVFARQGRMDLAAQELQQAIEISKQSKPKNRRRWAPSN
ncbi:tetratricopeptide repeat protein [Bdellovibrio sp. HCB337]|uniref:tetratricopeptide repeat protein n=1 Tax=Bdellovibrio sp. HCB337 TaxID=3394358 RepID=UPI0039A5BE3F